MRTKQPNILFFFSDQFRYDCLGCSGNSIILTPNLDRLAKEGVYFKNAFTPTPVCIAARISLITGLRGAKTHHVANFTTPGPVPEHPTIMTLLHQAGYHTQGIGKTHFKGRHYGFINTLTQEETPSCILDDDYLLYLRENGVSTRFIHGCRDLLYYQPQTLPTARKHSPNEWVADRSIQFLREHSKYRKDKPFFLWSSYINPHPPFAPVEPYASMYRPESMSLPINPKRPLSSMPYGAVGHRARLDGAHNDPERMQRIKALYYGLVSHVDECIGKTLAELEYLGLADDTVIIFASDHGDMLGDHGLSQKNVPYEQSVRIPLIIKWPGASSNGMAAGDFVSLVDILPTLMEGIGFEYPGNENNLSGVSLMPCFFGGKLPDRNEFFIDYGCGESRWVCVRDRRYKYTYWLAEGYEELYDLETDPYECCDLSDESPGQVNEFRSKAIKWELMHGLKDSVMDGVFRKYSMPAKPSEDMCRFVSINNAKWADNLPAGETQNVDSYARAFNKAISKETTLSADKLSIRQFREKGGSLEGTLWEKYWKE